MPASTRPLPALQGRPYKVVYNSSSLAGQIAAVAASKGSKAVDSLQQMRVQTLRQAGR